MSLERECRHCGAEYDLRHGGCPVCLVEARERFEGLVEGFPTREGIVALAWESFKRLSPKRAKRVVSAMNGEDDGDEYEEIRDWIEGLARKVER